MMKYPRNRAGSGDILNGRVLKGKALKDLVAKSMKSRDPTRSLAVLGTRQWCETEFRASD